MGRLLQHLFAETAALTTGATLVALAVAATAIQLVAHYGAGYIPRIDEIRMSARVLVWLAGLAVVSGATTSSSVASGIPTTWGGSVEKVGVNQPDTNGHWFIPASTSAPTHGTIVHDPVCWEIQYGGRPVGHAVSQAVPGHVDDRNP